MNARGAVPPNYREVRYWKLTGNFWNYLVVNLVAIVALVVFGAFFLWFAARFGGLQRAPMGPNWWVGLLGGAALTLVLHELAHGAAMRLFGATPRYGVQWQSLVAYATAPGYAFTRDEYLMVSLAPLAGLSLLAMLAMLVLAGSSLVWLLALCAAFNAAGAGGDLWMSGIVVRCRPEAYIVDERDGMRVFLPN